MTRPSAAPSEPPNSISGPSRPIDIPVAMADQDESTRETVVRSESCTFPSATASMTLLTPWTGVARSLAIRPAPAPPTAGRPTRIHHGSLAIASTTLPAPRAIRYQRVSELRNAMANAAAPRATRHSAIEEAQAIGHRVIGARFFRRNEARSPTRPSRRPTEGTSARPVRSSQRRAGPDAGAAMRAATGRPPSAQPAARIRSAARDITSRGGRLFPSARQAATVVRRRAAIVPQHAHALMCRSTVRRRAGVRSPSRYRDNSSSSARQRADGRAGTVISRLSPSSPGAGCEPDASAS